MSRNTAATEIESDAALVSHMAAGDQRAMGILYDRHGAAAYALACAITSRPSIAESAIADAFAQVWRDASTFDPQRMSFLAWLMSIVRTRALAARSVDAPVPRVLSVEGGGALGIRAGSSNAITPGVTSLDALQARAVELAYFGGKSKGEIARELRLTEIDVAQLLRSAVDTLRRSLAPNDPSSVRGALTHIPEVRAVGDSPARGVR